MPDQIEVKQAPTKATMQRTTPIVVGGAASTTVLTFIVAYLFTLYADAHPGFRTPVQVMGAEVGAAIYAFFAGCVTGMWQSLVSWMVRGTLIVKGPDENEGA